MLKFAACAPRPVAREPRPGGAGRARSRRPLQGRAPPPGGSKGLRMPSTWGPEEGLPGGQGAVQLQGSCSITAQDLLSVTAGRHAALRPPKETGTFIALWHEGVTVPDFPMGPNVWAPLLPQHTEKGPRGSLGGGARVLGSQGSCPARTPDLE